MPPLFISNCLLSHWNSRIRDFRMVTTGFQSKKCIATTGTTVGTVDTFVRISKVAIAIAIIRTKPAGVSSREYTERLARLLAEKDEGWKHRAKELRLELDEVKQRYALVTMQLQQLGLVDVVLHQPPRLSTDFRPTPLQPVPTLQVHGKRPLAAAALSSCASVRCRVAQRNYDFLSSLISLQSAHCSLELHRAGRTDGGGEVARTVRLALADSLDLLLDAVGGRGGAAPCPRCQFDRTRKHKALQQPPPANRDWLAEPVTADQMRRQQLRPGATAADEAGDDVAPPRRRRDSSGGGGLVSPEELLERLLLVLDSEGFGVLRHDADVADRLKALCAALLTRVLRGGDGSSSKVCHSWLRLVGSSGVCRRYVITEILETIARLAEGLHRTAYEGAPLDVDAFENAEKVVALLRDLRSAPGASRSAASGVGAGADVSCGLSEAARGFLRQLTLHYPVLVLSVEQALDASSAVAAGERDACTAESAAASAAR